MKKLLYSILALAGVTMASCTQEHVEVQYVPGNVVAPILGDIGDLQLKEGNSDITIDYVKADFGLPAVSADVLYVSVSEDMSSKRRVNAKFEDGVITVTNLDLNTAINNAGATPEEATQAYFAIISSLVTDKGAIISSSEVMSNIVSANVTPFLSEIIPSLKYGKMYVVGSFNNWDHVAVEQNFDFLYDYEGNGQFSGVIDFRAPGAIEFKLTAGAWGVEEHSASGPHDAEASTITLVAGGGENIKAWGAKRFYGATFDKSGLTLKKSWSADQIGIVGGFTNWADGADVVMQWNPKWGRFYADIELSADTELKFRADGAWDLNWGADCAVGGGNIAVAAGNYRVYFNPMIGFIEFNTQQYGKDEDITGGNTGGGGNEEPEPTPTGTWDVMGDFENDNWSTGYAMEAAGDLFVAQDVVFANANGEGLVFKVRKDANWDTSYGVADATAREIGAAIVLDGTGNIAINGEVGVKYDIYLRAADMTVIVVADGDTPAFATPTEAWDVMGDFENDNWSTGYTMEAAGDLFVAQDVVFANANGEGLVFKVRKDHNWDTSYGVSDATARELGATIKLDGTGNIAINGEAGVKYDIYLRTADMSVVVVADGETPAFDAISTVVAWDIMGDFENDNWTTGYALEAAGDLFVAQDVVFANANGEGLVFKVRQDHNWDTSFGVTDTTAREIGSVINLDGGSNIAINGEVGVKYDIYFNATSMAVVVVADGGTPEF